MTMTGVTSVFQRPWVGGSFQVFSAHRLWRQTSHHVGSSSPVQVVARASPPGMRTFDRPADSQLPVSPTTTSSSTKAPVAKSVAAPVAADGGLRVNPYRVSLWDALKFYGPAPEKINSRLAMLAMVLVPRTEMLTGETVLQQAQHPPWAVLALAALIVYGSLVPLRAGAIDEPFGVFTPLAERLNGRLAMLGFVGLLALEWYTEVPFF